MAVREFTCPNCGAPIDYDGSDTPTVRCAFCNTSVIIPPELRPRRKPEPAVVIEPPVPPPPRIVINTRVQPITPANRRALTWIFVLIVLIGLASVFIPLLLIGGATKAVSDVVLPNVQETARQFQPGTTVAPAPTELPTATPTPAFAVMRHKFGAPGIGPGMLNDARYLSIDGAGRVYAADYMDGRIQVFDADGKFLHGWQVGDEDTIIYGMAASQNGTLYLAYAGNLYRYDGATGELLGQIPYERGPEFGDLAAMPDGGVLAMWYEGRWGLINSLQGHREDLVRFDANGSVVQVVEGLLSSQTESLALDVLLAADGVGNIYATDTGSVYKFASDGRYLDRFAPLDENRTIPFMAGSITVDGRGRVYLGGSYEIAIFSPDGRFLKMFETDISIRSIAFAPNGDLYVLSGDEVARYNLGVLP